MQRNAGQRNTQQKRGAVAESPQRQGLPRWIDWMMVVVILAISAFSLAATVGSGVFDVSLAGDTKWSWYLVRSAGMTAYTLLAASMLWGLFLSSRILKDWSPGPLTLLLHATTSWLAVVLSAAHALLLMFDKFYTYTLPDLIVPFIGPYRPFAVGLGVVAFWLTLAVTVSFSMRKLIGHRNWLWLHYTSYGAFALITVHALLAGTDASQSGIRLILFGFAASVAVLLSWRVVRDRFERRSHAQVKSRVN
jgi:methionine sulfoxide reductase heme-binding subunit